MNDGRFVHRYAADVSECYAVEPASDDLPLPTGWWTIAGIDCPRCGKWGRTGLWYPSIDPRELDGLATASGTEHLPPADFAQHIAALRKRVGDALVLGPTTSVGSRAAVVDRRPRDLYLPCGFELLARLAVWEELSRQGVRLGSAPVPCEFTLKRTGEDLQLSAVDIPPRARLVSSLRAEAEANRCSICGRLPITLPDRDQLRFERESIPTDLDLFRGAEATTVVLATQRFVDVVSARAWKGARFLPVGLE
ncbi:double-CXXCG motif protein [Sandaracinus amylolyticus]|uniref:double-CXXCG motif protein n=1 Tax=Sandaracinus amylolyticus TaxID=927083 RepID=UPI00147072C3|nr:double-CXXCG motif protein [Sandaracinus amylolyticus]